MKVRKNVPPMITGGEDLFNPPSVKTAVNIPPIVFVIAFVVIVAMASLIASVL